MFTIADLTNAGLATTKNPTLQKLYVEVTAYNGLPAGDHAAAVRLLDKIMKHAAVYLTSKKPQVGKTKNDLRWIAMTNLANQAAIEARAHEVKLLHSPADFRNIKGDPKLNAQSYWLERVDPLHRPGYVLSAEYEKWISKPDLFAKKKSFWDKLGSTGSANEVMMVKGDDGAGNLWVEAYRITFDAGAAKDSIGDIFCTKDLETAHSGKGWAVFVCSPGGGLYARAHEAGFFHHSSFLAGKPVAAAGELLVNEVGKILIVTNKTGHYRAGADEMRRLLALVPGIPGDAFILPDYLKMLQPPAGQNQALLYRCDDFRANGTAATVRKQAEVAAMVPAWANTTNATRALVNKSPV